MRATRHQPACREPNIFPLSGVVRFWRDRKIHGKGKIAVVCAGTSDMPVAEEAQVTAETMGNQVETIHDIGVAGIHRLMQNRERITEARVVVVCAGMEGALPSVVGGLVSCPVIAVPTSVGYGASFNGLAALLGMLNSCASNVSVVNIDNGFRRGLRGQPDQPGVTRGMAGRRRDMAVCPVSSLSQRRQLHPGPFSPRFHAGFGELHALGALQQAPCKRFVFDHVAQE